MAKKTPKETLAVQAAAKALAKALGDNGEATVASVLPAVRAAIGEINNLSPRGDAFSILCSASYAAIVGLENEAELSAYSRGGAKIAALIEAVTLLNRFGDVVRDARFLSSYPGIWLNPKELDAATALIDKGTVTLNVDQLTNRTPKAS